MSLPAGSLPWLVWQDLRLSIRAFGFGKNRLWALGLYALFIVLLHGGAGIVLWAMFKSNQAMPVDKLLEFSGVLLLSLEFFMLMAALIATFRLILAGRELSLHLSSPLPFRRIMAMRVLSLIVSTWAISILLVTPVANMGALLGRPVFLLAYPVTVMLAALTVAIALAVMGLTVRLFGLVRARRVLQLLQAGVPLLFVVGSLVGRDPAAPPATAGALDLSGRGLSTWAGVLRLPALALTGDGAALLTLLLLASLSLIAAARFAAPVVLLAVQSPEPAAPKPRAAGESLQFDTRLFRVLLRKEWRTILRDARLAIALAAQPLLIVAFFYGNLFSGEYRLAAAVAATTFFAAQLSQYIANLMISAEESPALLGSAPQPRSRLIAYKCIAALTPVLAMMALAAIWAALQDPWVGLVCLVCGFGAGFCACAIEVARPYPVTRRSFVQVAAARRNRDPLDILSVLAMQFGWAGAAWFLAIGSPWGAAVVLLVVLVPFFEWWRDANRQALLGY
ncbi:MAG: hypothetical protein C0434_16105 [Xanthomonadaceae bacterium]|nr:hypothetical protein [Xanthomonadaceae bacterium]